MLIGPLGVIVAEHKRRHDHEKRQRDEQELIERVGQVKGRTGHFERAIQQCRTVEVIEVFQTQPDEQSTTEECEPQQAAAGQAGQFYGEEFEDHGLERLEIRD